MSETNNPYQQPSATLIDAVAATDFGPVSNARRTPIGHGATWLSEAWQIFTRNWGLWIAGALVLFMISMAMGFVPIIGSLVGLIVNPLIFAGVFVVARKMDQDMPVEFGDFFAGFQNRPGTLAALGLVNLLLMLLFAGIIGGLGWVLLGGEFSNIASAASSGASPEVGADSTLKLWLFVLLMLAIMIPWMALLWFALPLLALDDTMTIGKALMLSLKGCLKNILPMMLYGLLGAVLLVISMIPFGLGLLVTLPLLMISMYTSLKDIFAAD